MEVWNMISFSIRWFFRFHVSFPGLYRLLNIRNCRYLLYFVSLCFPWYLLTLHFDSGCTHHISRPLHHPSPFKTTWCCSRDDYDWVSHRWSSALACAWTEASGSQISNSNKKKAFHRRKNEKQVCWSCVVLMLLFWPWLSIVCNWFRTVHQQ